MDTVFKALADKSRRRLLDRLFRKDGQSLGDLCTRAGMTRFGVMKHLKVLERAGLVLARRSGREKRHYLNPMPIRLAHDRWVSKYRAPFADALSQLKTQLEGNMAETQVYEIFIRTSPAKLWQALTDGEVTRRYFFGESIYSDFKRGSPWNFTGPAGKRDVEGEVLESDPPRKLSISWHVLYDDKLAR
ncbi:MAG TPA: metalloregulator ArsR/SmtB family transcription factor, partial [Myxococcales bacterium]|nr:metalloregulator ArsR/SmtB family transcription factor [Myxococcales bacterium]